MHDTLLAVPAMFAADLMASLPAVAALALFGTMLSFLPGAGRDGAPWWRKPDLATDIGYIVLLPAVMHYGRIIMLMGFAALLPERWQLDHGPLASLSFGEQMAAYLAASELLLYGSHRLLHRRLWRFHAVHHSSEHLEWISTHRVHPVDLLVHGAAGDCCLLMLGVSPAVLIWMAPFSLGMGALVHANLRWDWGPLRYVLVSPAMHRWHHTGVDRGGGANFASNLALLDVLFGTFYLPRGERPSGFGVTERDVPGDIGGQWFHPFRRERSRVSPLTPASPRRFLEEGGQRALAPTSMGTMAEKY